MRYKVLDSKVQIPEIQKNLMIRQRLLKKLNNISQRMVIFHGTVGYGKTVLMSHYARLYEIPCAWYHLDDMDNNVRVFLSYLAASFQNIYKEIPFEFNLYPENMDEEFVKSYFISFIADLNQYLEQADVKKEKIILVLDDFQTIKNPLIFEFIHLLILYSPECLKLFIATKSCLPEFAAACILRDEACVVGAKELAFTCEEVSGVLEKILHQDVSTEMVQDVYRKAEGWPAGTMFMAQYFKTAGCPEKNTDWDMISDEALIQNYIMNELFRKLPFDIQQFLVKTSVLDELSAELCNYVLGVSDSRGTLNYLLQENLFILRINQGSGYYRYHSIFKMFLQHSIFAEQKKEILTKAGNWYLKKGNTDRAMECWMSCDNYHSTAEAFLKYNQELLREGQNEMLKQTAAYLRRGSREAAGGIYEALIPASELEQEICRVEALLETNRLSEDFHMKVQYFGGFHVYLGEDRHEMAWRTKKTAELFAFLLQRKGHAVKREELLRILWPEEYPNNAIAMLHNMFYNIRKELTPFGQNDRIVYAGKEYMMDVSGVSTDIAQIQRLCTAVEEKDTDVLKDNASCFYQYWGAFMEGIENNWCSMKKYYYEKCFLDGCELLGSILIREKNFAEAVKVFQAGLDADSYSERLAIHLIQCYGELGERKEGKKLYEKICRIYKEELGVLPVNELRKAYDVCLNQSEEVG